MTHPRVKHSSAPSSLVPGLAEPPSPMPVASQEVSEPSPASGAAEAAPVVDLSVGQDLQGFALVDRELGAADPRRSSWRELGGGKLAERFNVATTPFWVYTAWERTDRPFKSHNTCTTLPSGEWVGKVGTRELPPEIDTLPVGDERFLAVGKWHHEQHAESHDLIRKAFPEAAYGRFRDGAIEVMHVPMAFFRERGTEDQFATRVASNGDICYAPLARPSYRIQVQAVKGMPDQFRVKTPGFAHEMQGRDEAMARALGIIKRYDQLLSFRAVERESPAEGYPFPRNPNNAWEVVRLGLDAPTSDQLRLMRAVEEALKTDYFQSSVFNRVVEALGPTFFHAEDLKRNTLGTERGDAGYEVFMARGVVEGGLESRARQQKAEDLKVGEYFRNVRFNHKVYASIRVLDVDREFGLVEVQLKRAGETFRACLPADHEVFVRREEEA